MAKMTPMEFPRELANDPRRSAERKVFSALRDNLPDEYEAFYSRPWWGLDNDGSESHGEADFILGHPNKGVIFLEIKGGRASFDPQKNQWISTDRNGIHHRIKDPVNQAMLCMHKFLDLFKGDQIWPNGKVKVTYGVIFPDTVSPPPRKQTIGGHRIELFMFGAHFPEKMESWLDSRLRPGASEVTPGAAGMQVLRRVVADPAKLSFALRTVLEGEIADMDQYLLGFQHQVLAGIMGQSRTVVLGGAGTGKTVLAMELASRLASSGQRVKFVARSSNLVRYVERLLRNSTASVTTWEALDKSGPMGDCDWLIVDEAQDLNHENFSELSRLYPIEKMAIFLDSNQAIISNPRQVAERLGAEELSLRVNLRNTKSISKVTDKLFEGELPETIGPHGEKPTVEIEANSPMPKVLTHIADLLRSGIRQQQLTILSDSSQLRDKILAALLTEGIPAARFSEFEADAITVETVDDFKGLESEYLILALGSRSDISKQASYVAVSRARTRLHVISTLEAGLITNAIRDLDFDGQ